MSKPATAERASQYRQAPFDIIWPFGLDECPLIFALGKSIPATYSGVRYHPGALTRHAGPSRNEVLRNGLRGAITLGTGYVARISDLAPLVVPLSVMTAYWLNLRQ